MSRYHPGQSMVEIALTLPFLVLIILGVIEFSYYVYTYSEIENATRRVSEFAAKMPPLTPLNDNDACEQLAKAEAFKGALLSSLQSNQISFALPSGRTLGAPVEVNVNYTGQFLTPISHIFSNGTLNLRFTSRRTIINLTPPLGYKPDCTR